MLLQKNSPNHLKEFMLNSYESKLWLALLSRGVATAGELSDIANVPRSRTYDVLEGLEKKGFLIMKIGKPIKYIAIEPEHVIEVIRKRILEDAATQARIIKNLEGSDILNDLKMLHKTGIKKTSPLDFSGVFKGRKRIYNYIEKKIAGSKKQVLIQTTETGIFKDNEYLKPAIKKAKAKNVKTLIAAPITPHNRDTAKELSAHADIRHITTPGRFYIFDGEEILFMLLNDSEVHKTYEAAIWIKSPFFSTALKKLFNTSWKSLQKPQLD